GSADRDSRLSALLRQHRLHRQCGSGRSPGRRRPAADSRALCGRPGLLADAVRDLGDPRPPCAPGVAGAALPGGRELLDLPCPHPIPRRDPELPRRDPPRGGAQVRPDHHRHRRPGGRELRPRAGGSPALGRAHAAASSRARDARPSTSTPGAERLLTPSRVVVIISSTLALVLGPAVSAGASAGIAPPTGPPPQLLL